MNNFKKIVLYTFVLLLLIGAVVGGVNIVNREKENPVHSAPPAASGENVLEQPALGSGQLTVSVIDVGKGDSILITTPNGKAVLIDTAEPNRVDLVKKALKTHGVREIDYLVLTHPHNDHIGGAKEIIEEYKVLNIFMPRVNHTTEIYKNLLQTIQLKGIPVTQAKLNQTFEVDGASFLCVSPQKETYKEINDYSAVLQLTFGDNTFLLCGDAETLVEKEMLENAPLKADVIKIAHHGSDTSSSKKFIKAVSPTHAVISCLGPLNNTPNEKILNRLTEMGINVLRTDIAGDITFISDGNTIDVAISGEPAPGVRQ